MSQQEFSAIVLECTAQAIVECWPGSYFWKPWRDEGTVPAGAD